MTDVALSEYDDQPTLIFAAFASKPRAIHINDVEPTRWIRRTPETSNVHVGGGALVMPDTSYSGVTADQLARFQGKWCTSKLRPINDGYDALLEQYKNAAARADP